MTRQRLTLSDRDRLMLTDYHATADESEPGRAGAEHHGEEAHPSSWQLVR